jgi:hypothetical protein
MALLPWNVNRDDEPTGRLAAASDTTSSALAVDLAPGVLFGRVPELSDGHRSVRPFLDRCCPYQRSNRHAKSRRSGRRAPCSGLRAGSPPRGTGGFAVVANRPDYARLHRGGSTRPFFLIVGDSIKKTSTKKEQSARVGIPGIWDPARGKKIPATEGGWNPYQEETWRRRS